MCVWRACSQITQKERTVTLEEAKTILAKNGLEVEEEGRLGNDMGWLLRIVGGAIVNVYDKGTVTVQGRGNHQQVRALFPQSRARAAAPVSASPVPAPTAGPDKVFVVYGHDTGARADLERMLLRWGLTPLILDQLPSEGQTIIEKLEKYTGQVGFAVVLATPDDEGHRAGHPDEKKTRARQNVVLELGMLLSSLGRSRVAILLRDQTEMERPSDIHGLIYIPFKDDLIKDSGLVLAKELVAAGYHIDIQKL
jgi:predicted nucleotide-binding protein